MEEKHPLASPSVGDDFQPKSRRVTIRDIAKLLDLSHTTVSRVLNERDAPISEATRRRVIEMAQRADYHPNRAARALATGRLHLVTLWSRYLSAPYQMKIVHQLIHQIKKDGYELVVRGEEELPQRPLEWSNAMGFGADGVIIFDEPEFPSTSSPIYGKNMPPIVSMGAYYSVAFDYVGVDLYRGAVKAIQHLLEIGCQRIAFLSDSGTWQREEPRRSAYETVIRKAQRPLEFIVTPLESRSSARDGIVRYIQCEGCPDGIFCWNDEMAIGAYRGLCDLGIRIPDEAALIGCDGIEDTEYLEKPITTIMQPVDEMCALAWEFLKMRMENPSIGQQNRLLQPNLVIRQSSMR